MNYQLWIDKSTENLAAAQLCYDNGLFNACANRLYYAMFHAGVAVLIKHGVLPPPKNIGHDWVQSNFSGQLIHRRKVFSAKFRPYLSDSYWTRVTADYEPSSVSKKLTSKELKKAKEFINAVHSEISGTAQS